MKDMLLTGETGMLQSKTIEATDTNGGCDFTGNIGSGISEGATSAFNK